MPKVRNCKFSVEGVTMEGTLKVNSRGVFSIDRPGTAEDWPSKVMTIESMKADECEDQWKIAVRDLVQRQKVERKVLIVRFDSRLRTGGMKNFFNNSDNMLILECLVAVETKVVQGKETTFHYSEHPDHSGLHQDQPFPPMFRISVGMLRARRDQDWTVVDWTQDLEDILVRACEGVKAVIAMMESVFESPETLALAGTGFMAIDPPPAGLPILPDIIAQAIDQGLLAAVTVASVELAADVPDPHEDDPERPCRSCGETIGRGAHQHECDVCHDPCCTACSFDGPDGTVVCEGCHNEEES